MADDQCYKVSLMKAATFWPRALMILGALGFGIAMAAKEPFFEGLGSYARKVTTDSPEAQRYFNQGLAFLHGFNHGAAIASLQEARPPARPSLRPKKRRASTRNVRWHIGEPP